MSRRRQIHGFADRQDGAGLWMRTWREHNDGDAYTAHSRWKWKAEIRKGKKRVFRKFFERIEDAAIAIRIAREEIHGEFARHE